MCCYRTRIGDLVFACCLGVAVLAAPSRLSGADAQTLRFGMSTALSGPAADLGRDMRAGVEAAFSELNRQGGWRDRLLEIVVLDDGYEPTRTAPNMRRLIEQESVLAVVGNVGTPTAVVAIPIANSTRTPFVGAFTGAGVLRRNPPDRYVINLRASYAQETASMINALLEHGIRAEEIAFFTQRDAYGDAGFSSGMQVLESIQPGLRGRVGHGRYERNSLAVEGGLAELLIHEPEPKAVILVGAYAPCAKFIRLAHESDFRPFFLNLSFVGGESLARNLGEYGDGVIVTQVMPHVGEDLPLIRRAKQALETEGQTVTQGSLEGYAVGSLVIMALEGIDGPVNREALLESLESLGSFDLGMGASLRLGPARHQASDRVWPNVIHGGQVESARWQEILVPERPLP